MNRSKTFVKVFHGADNGFRDDPNKVFVQFVAARLLGFQNGNRFFDVSQVHEFEADGGLGKRQVGVGLLREKAAIESDEIGAFVECEDEHGTVHVAEVSWSVELERDNLWADKVNRVSCRISHSRLHTPTESNPPFSPSTSPSPCA